MRLNILVGGEAGKGPNFLAKILAEILIEKEFFVFYSRDYQSLIRGGHNFNVLTFSNEPVYSNDKGLDFLICLDDKTKKIHLNSLKKGGVILEGKYSNAYFLGAIVKKLGLNFEILKKNLEKSGKFDENVLEAKKGFESVKEKIKLKRLDEKKNIFFMNGNQGISDGAVKSGLDVYYAYPMTPATSVLNELAGRQKKDNILVLELENEIAVINAAIGSSITGAKTMVGTSGGGFDLMTEGLSLAGIAETPVVIYLSMRPGPGTGVATYTGQGDLNIALHSGHGEFPRMVLAPGNPIEAEELTSQAFYFSQKFGIPSIILLDKHLAESFYSDENKAVITPSKKTTVLRRYNSYETDEFGNSTESSEQIKKNVEERLRKSAEIKKEAEKFIGYKIYGNKNSKNVVVTWGSPTGAILDSIKNSYVKLVQIMYLEPFPEKIKREIEGKNLILVENDATGQLGELIAEKTGIFIDDKNKILRYDGRPFLADELKEEIRRRMK